MDVRQPLAAKMTLLLAFVLVGCAAPTAPSASGPANAGAPAAPQRTLVIANRGEPPTLASRSLVTQGSSLGIPGRFFNANLDVADVSEVSHPQLAEALPQFNTDTWRVFPDGRMETRYTLREGLTWHDGTPLNPADFAFALRVYKTPELGSSSISPIPAMDEIVTQDDRNFSIKWKQPYVEAAEMGVSFQALPRHILEKDFETQDAVAFTGHPFWTTNYVGLGPYKLDRWEPGAFLEGSAFDKHALGRPKIDKMRIQIINDPQTAMANVLAGEVHFVTNFTFAVDQGQVLEQQWASTGAGRIMYSPTQRRLGLIQMRPEYQQPKALADPRTRYAISHGMDDQTRVDVLDGGKGQVAYTLASPGLPYYPELDKAVLKHPFDMKRAQELLAEVGYTKGPDGFFVDGTGSKFTIEVASSAGGKNEQEAAVYVDSLRRTGFDAVQYVTPVAQIDDNETRVTRGGLALRGAGQEYRNYLTTAIPGPENRWRGNNRPGWSNPDFDRTFAQWEKTFPLNERVQLMAQMERFVSQDRAILMASWESLVNAVDARLDGVEARRTPDASGPEPWVFQWSWKS
jgi:peptide/nickel transport system substrate-binding protein